MSCQKRSSRETKIIQKVIETFKNTLVTLLGWKIKEISWGKKKNTKENKWKKNDHTLVQHSANCGTRREELRKKKKEANYFKRTPPLSSQFPPRLKLWILRPRGPTRNQAEWTNLDPYESTTSWNFLKFQYTNKGKEPLKLIMYKETKMRKALDFSTLKYNGGTSAPR